MRKKYYISYGGYDYYRAPMVEEEGRRGMKAAPSSAKSDIIYRISDFFLGRKASEILSPETRRRLTLFFLLSIVAIATMLAIGTLAWLQGNRLLALVDCFAAAALLLNMLAARIYRRYDLQIGIGIAVSALLFIYVFLTGGQNDSAFIWYYTFPLAALFLLGPHRGVLAALAMLVPVILLFTFDGRFPQLAAYSPDIKLRFIPSYLVILAFTYLFELSREKIYSELRDANSRLRELDTLKSMFIASVSHELRTPLNAIVGFTGVMLQELPGKINEEQRRQLSMVKNSAHHLRGLVEDVIDIGRIEADMVEAKKEPFQAGELVGEVCDLFAEEAEKKALAVNCRAAPECRIVSDRRRVRQVLMNLVDNAIKYTDRGEVQISVGSEGGTVTFTVVDTGVGIRPEDLEKLFEPFRQLTPGKGPKRSGSGLGLYLSHRIAELLGGRLFYNSVPGGGSSFSLTLPAATDGGTAPGGGFAG